MWSELIEFLSQTLQTEKWKKVLMYFSSLDSFIFHRMTLMQNEITQNISLNLIVLSFLDVITNDRNVKANCNQINLKSWDNDWKMRERRRNLILYTNNNLLKLDGISIKSVYVIGIAILYLLLPPQSNKVFE